MTDRAELWRAYDWKLIRGAPAPVELNHALDEVLTRAVGEGRRAPTIRFWNRLEPEIVLGRFQSVRNEVNVRAVERDGIKLTRRMTGGGAMLVEPGNDITYSIYAPPALAAGLSFANSYAYLDSWVITALRALGIDAWYEPINDITSAGGKIGGAAQARRFGAILHHATLAYDMAPEKLPRYLRIGLEKLSDKGIASAARRVGPLRLQTKLPRDDIIEHLIRTFDELYGLTPDTLKEEELAAAEELIHTKYATREWVYTLP